MLKVLSIGNSFSQDAQRYLHDIAKNEGVDMKCVNLYIGGCSLIQHYKNILGDGKYAFELNGESTGLFVTIKEALLSDQWDFVTLQQVSGHSPNIHSYSPYIEEVAKYVRKHAPEARLYIHQTWAYEDGCNRLLNELHMKNHHEMLDKIVYSYNTAKELIGADGIIPSGENMMKAIEAGVGKVHRDTFHADLGIGRYILGTTWFKALTGRRVLNDFDRLDIPTTPEQRLLVRNVVNG